MKTAHTGMKRMGLLLVIMLVMFGMVSGAEASSINDSNVILPGDSRPTLSVGGTNDLDGSKIEGVKVVWVTQDSATTAEGDPTPQAELDNKEHLYLSSVSNGEMNMVYKIEAEFSGQYDYAPGDITITIPAQVWRGRKYVADENRPGETVGVMDEGKLLGYLELPIPAAPSKQADFNWQIINGNYVLTNTRTIGATSSVSIEVGIRGIRPVDVVDMSETALITAHVEVVTNQGNTIELTSKPITAQLDTRAKITGAYKNGEVFEDYPGLDEKLLANLPAGAKPEDYIYVRWYTHHSHNNNQPYSLDIADVLSDAYKKVPDGNGKTIEQKVTDGIFLGSTNYEGQVLTDSETDFTAEIGDHFGDTTTGTQYANTVYMWSAYRKDAFEVPNANEPQRVYYFKNKVTWTLTETDKAVADAGLDKGEDKQKVTTAWDEVVVPYAPVKWQRPTGAFAVNKWTEAVGHKDWLYGYALNLLESRDEVDMDFIVETVGYGYPWTSELTKGFSYGELNNTVVNGDLESLELDASMFGKLGWKQVTDDFQTFFNFEKEPLTSEDFEFKSLRVSVPRKMRYAKQSNGTWDYVTDSKLPTPDLVIEYQLNNEDTWYPAATATWGEDGLGQFAFKDVNTAGGVTTSGMTVYFPENVTDTRHTFVSNVFGGKTAETCDIAMLDWYVYPTITMKSSDRVYGIVQELFEQSENPSTKFKNDVIMDAYGWVEAEGEGTLVLNDDFDSSLATYEGASYGVSLTKSGSSRSDVENQRLIVHYTATVTEQSNLKERSDYDAAVAAGVIPAETSGVWYDLLPPHVVPLLDTVKLRGGDTITNVYTVENYKDTGRTLLVVEADLTPVPTYANSLGYADRPRLEFDAAYTWMDMDEYGRELVNYVAFESTVDGLRNDTLGTIKNQKGDPDTPAGGNNATTPSMPEDIIEALTDLDPNTDENRFVYGKTSNTVSALTYAVSGLEKAVKNDLVGIWTQGLDKQEQVTVYEGHHYTYRLRVSSAETTCTKGIVIYDTIENFILPDPAAVNPPDPTKAADFAHTQERKDWSGDWQGKGQWRGTLESVDLSEFVNAKVKPVLLYSTIPNLQFADTSSESTDDNFDEDTELLSSGNYDITNREIWQVAELDEKGVWQVPEGLNVTAVAIDATTTVDGEEFVLRPEEALAGYLKMRAPDDEGDEGTWNAKGAYARKADAPEEIDWEAAMNKENNMYAYNNARVRLIQGVATNDGGANWLSSYRMIRNDYTRVGIVPEIVTVEKKWQDQENHDAMRPESVTISVLRRLAGTAGKAQPVLDKDGQPITAVLDKSNGWKAEFHQMDIVNEDGVRYLYSFEEVPVEGYTSKVQFIDVNHYTMTNVHPNEQIDVSGVKTWEDNENALGLRPDRVTVKLYRDGVQIDTRTVKANGAGEWKYSFGNLDKYAEGGIPYKYEVKEEYVPKYVGEADGYEQVKNTYIPVGELEVSKTLVNATAVAQQQEFTFTLVLLAEKTDPAPDAPAVPLMEKYPYTIYTQAGEEWVPGATGEIGNSGVFKLKENQKIVVEGLPSEATYQVIESEAAGFTSTATDATGTIRAGQTAQAAFVNEYKASGSVQLNVGKSLTGHAIRKNQFRFELVDNNPDSSTYGEVIRTARVEAPKEGATTGGSGVEIESLTQAIFGQLEYTQADHGQTYSYQVREVDTGKLGYTTDDKVYDVAVSVTDNGDGTMTVTPDWGEDDSMLFKNTYTATGELTLKAWKTLEGRELKKDEFTFELWSYDASKNGLGEKLGEATNDADGNIVFDALEFNQDHVSLDEKSPAKYTYLIREKQGTDKTVAYSNQEYVMTVTVFDNGDGTLSFAQGSQGYEREYVTCPVCNGETSFVTDPMLIASNTLSAYYIKDGEWKPTTPSTGTSEISLCNGCLGFAYINGRLCPDCKGSGLHLGGVKSYVGHPGGYYHFTEMVYKPGTTENDRAFMKGERDKDGQTYYFYTDLDVMYQTRYCEECDTVGVVADKLTITGDVTIPVFANELKPGNLAVTKKVQGEGSTDPDQLFDFTIKLTGEVPAKLDYGMVAPTPAPTATPTATPAPEVTPKPAAVKRTPSPTTKPTVMPTTKPVDPFKATDLEGEGFAIINPTTNEMVFFRAAADTNGVYTYNGKASGYNDITFSFSDVAEGTNYMTLTATDGSSYQVYRDFESNKGDPSWPWNRGGDFYKKVTSVSMEGDIKPETTTGYMFQGFSAATSIDLSRLDTSNVTSVFSMFHSCEKLEELVVSGLDTSKVTTMGNMFYGCKKLQKLDLSSFNTSNVQVFGSMFADCNVLSELRLENFDTISATSMANMFYGCHKLKELDLRTFDTSKVTTMFQMFSCCRALESLYLSSFNTSNVTDMSYMFFNCMGLEKLDLSNFNTSKVTTMKSMFSMFYYGIPSTSKLKSLDLSSFDTSNVEDMQEMFRLCISLDDLNLSSFNTGTVKNMHAMFEECNKLTALDVSNFDTSNVTNMSSMFNKCSKLANLDVSNFDTSNVTNMSSMFSGCSSLPSLDLSNFDTSSVTNMSSMFSNCSKLTALDLRNFNVSKVTNMNGLFYHCTNLLSLDLSSFRTGIGNTNSMFSGCSKLSTVTICNEMELGSYSGIPNNSTYTGKWVKVDDDTDVQDSKPLFTEGGHAGTWTWEKKSYTLNFAAGDGAGSMPSIKVLCGEAYTFVPLFYNFGYDLVGFSDDGSDTVKYPVSGGLVTIPASTYQHGDNITLTAVWQERDVNRSESGDSISFSLKADETFTLNNLPATTAYEVWENTPAGWVLVSKVDDSGIIQPLETSNAVFTNEYNPKKASVILRASKLLDGKPAKEGAFTFALKDPQGNTIETVTSKAGGVIEFAPIIFTEDQLQGAESIVSRYMIHEINKTDSTLNYDGNYYEALIEVSKDPDTGALSAVVNYYKNAGNEKADPIFRNTTKPGALKISKVVPNRLTEKAKEQEFTFEVTFMDELMQGWNGTLKMGEGTLDVKDGKASVTLKGGESVTLENIPAGLKYQVEEIGSYPGWLIMRRERPSGTIAAAQTAESKFTNAYSLSGQASIEVKKELVGRDLTKDEFTFKLLDQDGKTVENKDRVAITATNGADGSVLFPQMTYTKEGEWVYRIVEVIPSEDKIDNTVEYSTEEIVVTVTAKDEKGDGNLTVTVAYDPDKTPITNTLKPGALEISKKVVSTNPAHDEKVFTFTVELTDKDGKPLNGSYVLNDTASIEVQDGEATITLSGGESAVISGLPAGTQYSVTETAEAGFIAEMTGESGIIESTKTAEASFTNTYAAQGVYDFNVTKTLSGREMTEGEFEFVLLDEAGNELETARNTADGKVSFSRLTFRDPDVGTKTYSIKETDLKSPGVTYDKTVQEITLTITDNGDGTLSVTDSLNGEAAEFENSYNDKTSVSVKKVWQDEDDKLSVRPDSVTVELYRNGEKQTKAVLNAENEWQHTFGDLAAFDEEGITYTYTVKEVPVAGYDSMQSLTDGARVITNTVQGVLDVSKTVVGGTDESKEFTFTVTLTKADAPLTTELVLAKDENSETVTTDEEGRISFTLKHGETARLIGLPIGTSYKVEETEEAGYATTAENAEGLIQRYEEHKASFTNTYEAKGETTFSGKKTLEGRELKGGEFSFTLLDKDGNTIETVQNAADGSFAFTKLEYIHNAEKSELGEYAYMVKEVAGDLGGVTYDEKKYAITVTVTDNGDGTLEVVASDNVTALDFTNTYEAKGETSFSGKKMLVGRELAEGEFSFTLYDANGDEIETVRNAADGSFAFTKLEYIRNAEESDLGQHSYTVKEVQGALGGVTYDEKEYAIIVNVSDNGDGTLEVVASDNAEALDFVNSYEAKGETSFSGKKTLEGRELAEGEFSFTLYDSKGNAIETVKNAADGSFAFTKLEYIRNADKSDLGEHCYTVKEIKGALKGVTYDDAEYTVKVTVTDNGDGTLKVVASENAAVLDFTNYYDADGELTLRAVKTVNGAEPRADEVFTFELCDAAGKVLQTAKNQQGKITFEALKYTETDVGKSFLYTVKEQQEEKPGYTTDATVYTVAVWVADGGDGSLKVTKAISSEGKAVEAMTFENTYEAEGQWKPTAAKTVNGAEPREDQVYEFTLTDENGNTILAENEKGEITFDTLNYDLADAGKTYTYKVQEITTPTDLLAKDDSIYTVDVTVTDNKDGTLDVKPVITKGEKEVEEISFENKLTTLLSISKTVEGIETEDTFPMTVKLYNANGTEAEGEYAYTGDAEGKLKSGDAIELAHGQSVTISGLLPGMKYTVTEAAAAAYETTVNGNAGNSVEGTLAENENSVAFVNKFKTTMFMVKKSWQGGGGGAIELTLYANGEKIEPQPVYSRDENVYVYTDLPMYDAQEQPIVYSAKEKYVDGFLTIYKNVAPYADETKAIYDGGTIINKAIVKADFSVKKVWSGLAEGEEAPAIELVLYCNGEATEYKTPKPDRNGWYKYYDLPGEVDGKLAVYTVKELPVEGYETSYNLANGTSAEYADNGGTITNAKIPQTGDETPLALWLTLMGASAMMLVLLLKRRKA